MSANPRRNEPPQSSPGSSHPAEDTARPPTKKRHGSEKRQREKVISVRCKESEAALIDANAAAVDLCASAFLRTLGTGQARRQERRRPLPELLPFTQAMGRLGIYASNAYQLLRLANRGEVVAADELREAAENLRQATDELRQIIREYSE
jgi:hypothetical protein